MCGRYSLAVSFEELSQYFRLSDEDGNLEPHYNIAPSQNVPVVRLLNGKRALASLHWGLIPHWAKDLSIGNRLINARSETADQKPSFRSALRSRRCLIPASGFFEWKKDGKNKQPFYIFRKDGAPLALAGLWEHWQNQDGTQIIESCTILTTVANDLVARLHDRMPVILNPEDFDLWLDPAEHHTDKITPLLRPIDPSQLTMHSVSRYVNKPGNQGPECISPFEPTHT